MKETRQLGRGGLLGNLKGQAGVYAVASQLCMRGQLPSFPAVDHGYDLILDNGLKLQVKVAHLTYPMAGSRNNDPTFGIRGGKISGNYLGGAYGFNLRRGVWDKTANRQKRNESRTYVGVADFFVLWGIDENRFWIVPTSIKNRIIWFGRTEHPNNSNNATHTNAIKLQRIAAYENRWDLLDVNKTVEAIIESEPVEVREEKA